MPADEVAVHLRARVPRIHHAVEGDIQMRVVDSKGAHVPLRAIVPVEREIGIGIVVISQFACMRLHISVHLPLVYRTGGRHIDRHRTEFLDP